MAVPLYQLRITLRECEPLIWRRVIVKRSITGRQLHRLIQAAMGWRDYHLYEIQAAGKRFGELNPYGFDDGVLPAKSIRLNQLLPNVGDHLTYIYDFGDEWWHEVLLEDMPSAALYRTLPVCVAGERACPTESTGGAEQFMELVDMLQSKDPKEVETAHVLLERNFRPENFKLQTANRRLRKAFRRA